MNRTVHICQSIDGALKNWDKNIWKLAFPETDWRVSKKWFELQKHEGKKVIPSGEPCEGFSYQTGCPGHEVTKG